MEPKSILLDTSFFIRLLNDQDPLHHNVLGYYRYFLEQQFILKTSTIAIAEYCVKGNLAELPLQDVQIIPFNINHAERAGKLASIVFQNRNLLDISDRKLISNDTKLFAQADIESHIHQFATSDQECLKIFNLLNTNLKLNFEVINVRKPYNETFGLLF